MSKRKKKGRAEGVLPAQDGNAAQAPSQKEKGQIDLAVRRIIEDFLDHGAGFGGMGLSLGYNRTTISREVKGRRFSPSGSPMPLGHPCVRIARPPFVCNGCEELCRCRLEKWYYKADRAQREYRELLSSSRRGVDATAEELAHIDRIIADGIAKGESVHHIIACHRDDFSVCEKTVYNLINSRMLSVRRHHLPAAPYRRPRPRKSKPVQHKVDRECLVGRRPEDYGTFIAANPGAAIVEMDSVEGRRGGKVLLTLHFIDSGLMLAFIRDRNTARSVIDTFDMLEMRLGAGDFRRIFPVLKTDNGAEFSDPAGIETSLFGGIRTRVFYCHPYSSYEKPHVENNHENLRRIFPKGVSFDAVTQDQVELALSHVNSMIRKGFGDVTAIERFRRIYGGDLLEKLGMRLIPADQVTLRPGLVGLKDK